MQLNPLLQHTSVSGSLQVGALPPSTSNSATLADRGFVPTTQLHQCWERHGLEPCTNDEEDGDLEPPRLLN